MELPSRSTLGHHARSLSSWIVFVEVMFLKMSIVRRHTKKVRPARGIYHTIVRTLGYECEDWMPLRLPTEKVRRGAWGTSQYHPMHTYSLLRNTPQEYRFLQQHFAQIHDAWVGHYKKVTLLNSFQEALNHPFPLRYNGSQETTSHWSFTVDIDHIRAIPTGSSQANNGH